MELIMLEYEYFQEAKDRVEGICLELGFDVDFSISRSESNHLTSFNRYDDILQLTNNDVLAVTFYGQIDNSISIGCCMVNYGVSRKRVCAFVIEIEDEQKALLFKLKL